MRDANFFLKNLWRWKCGVPEETQKKKKPLTLERLRKSQWSPRFEQLMRNRLLIGGFRYPPLDEQEQGAYDRIGSIRKRLKKYKKSGNMEYLVDSANMCMVEFMKCAHPKAHFKSVDDGEHAAANA